MRFVPVWFAVFLLVVASAYFFLFVRVECHSVERLDLDFGRPYIHVLVRLGRKESMERMLAANGGTLVEKHWDSFDLHLAEPPFVSTWNLSADGRFKIKNSSGHVAEESEDVQSVRAQKGSLSIRSDLSCGNGYVKKHETRVSVGGGRVCVGRVENEIVYERVVPYWMESYLRGKIEEYNRGYVERLGSCMESIVKE